MNSDLLLLGFDRPARALDVDALEERFGQPDFSAGFARVEIDSFPQLLAHELLPLGTLHAVELEGPVHTLRNPILSYLAARAFFPGKVSSLPPYLNQAHQNVSRRNSLLRRYGGGGERYAEEILEAAAREQCRLNHLEHCVTFFGRWAYEHPQSTRLETVVAETRTSLGSRRSSLAPKEIHEMQLLFGGEFNDTRLTVERAQQLTNRFFTHFNHAVPFDVGVIETIWNHCRGPRCAEARRKVNEKLRTQLGGILVFPDV